MIKITQEIIDPPSGYSFRVIRWKRTVAEVESVFADGMAERFVGEGAHWHSHVAMELTFFMTGEGTRYVGDHIGNFEAGDLVLLGEKLPHYWETTGRSSGISLQWDFPNGHPFWGFPETVELMALFKKAERGIHISGENGMIVADLMREILRAGKVERLGLLFRLLGFLTRIPSKDGKFLSSRSFSQSQEKIHEDRIEKVVRHLFANFREEIRLEQMLKLADMSKATFSRQFKAHVGHCFSHFLLKIRLQAAARELQHTHRTITEIAHDCGFGQVSLFNKHFLAWKGTSPRRWLKNLPSSIENPSSSPSRSAKP